MILIADSGSTKTSWCLKKTETDNLCFTTEGYNPYYVDSNYVSTSISKALPPEVEREKVLCIYFYGAGCSVDKVSIMETGLKRLFPNAVINVELDLLAAARAVLGTNAGFAAILGTGTNTCFFNGKSITSIVDSLGFIMGDEGSGGYLGKKLLSAYCRDYLPEELKSSFYNTYNLTPSQIISEIYSSELPNRFCASFCKFIKSHEEHPFIKNMLKCSFRDFFKEIVCHYPHYNTYSFNCIGSIAISFLPLLTEVAQEFNMKIGNVLKNPIEGLIAYHQ